MNIVPAPHTRKTTLLKAKNTGLLPLLLSCLLLTACGTNKTPATLPDEAPVVHAAIDQNLIPKDGNLKTCANWQEFVAAAEGAEPGDVIQLKNGTYAGNIKFTKSGTAEKPITIIPESRGKVLINGNSQWEINGSYITVDGFYFTRGTSTRPVTFAVASRYSRFINSAIIDWNLGGSDTRLITLRGANNEVGHCFLRGKNTPGMMLEVVRESAMRNDHRIHHVYFGYFKDPGSGNGFETVRISTSGHSLSSSYTTLENCVFERCDGESEIISSKSGHNTFRNNTFLNSDGALTLRHGHDALVEGNFFINTRNSTSNRCNGVRVIGERQVVRNNYFFNLPVNSQAIQIEYGNEVPHKLTFYDQVKDAVIENNTVYNCDKGIRIGASKNPRMDPPRTMAPYGIFRNNLIVSDKGTHPSLEIEDEVFAKNLFRFSNNVISGKENTNPDKSKLPAGIQFIENLKMEGGKHGLFWPADKSITAGVQENTINPVYQTDIVPAWVKVKMDANDPAFVGAPW
ncbi:polysaccharide lyase 6 family protein [Botryobacter ruber]|uniref:polysaccharide lyase 6 family protein n=1 Tax=Botryobacter ruber TaxID=2171629 RepID=UPI000E0BE66D|nr:polysaccharide lyase 6 family protein [Botryobacter ruber]